MASSSLCKTASYLHLHLTSKEPQTKSRPALHGAGVDQGCRETGGQDTPLLMSSAVFWLGCLWIFAKMALGRQGDLSSEPGPMFPSACVPTLVELMLAARLSRGRVSLLLVRHRWVAVC